MAAATSVHVVAIVEPIIQHADWFFPEGTATCSCCGASLPRARFRGGSILMLTAKSAVTEIPRTED